LPKVIETVEAGRHILIAEGERDCETLRAQGRVATTNPCGAEKWRREFDVYLTNAKVAILVDNDDVGRRHTAQVAAHLAPFAGSVRIIELPDLPEHGDVSDWLAEGHTAEELREEREDAEQHKHYEVPKNAKGVHEPVRGTRSQQE
jgi:putative DNA primase/helicase